MDLIGQIRAEPSLKPDISDGQPSEAIAKASIQRENQATGRGQRSCRT